MSARPRDPVSRASAVVYRQPGRELPTWVARHLTTLAGPLLCVSEVGQVLDTARRTRPSVVVLDARDPGRETAEQLLEQLKRSAYLAVVPCVTIAERDAHLLLDAGADEVVAAEDSVLVLARLNAVLRRSARDLSTQPTTHLPGASSIQEEIRLRIAAGDPFAACYADLDHFKEFNDRYGFHEGDRVIRVVARVLHDAAVGVVGPEAFVGHIGGDDFMLVLPLAYARAVCELALEVFDALVPLQYTDADRRAGYYFGKDRRGSLHRVPLMSLSIGVATTERRRFREPAEVSRLASEMKTFAKAKSGSVYAFDRRGDELVPPPSTAP